MDITTIAIDHAKAVFHISTSKKSDHGSKTHSLDPN